MVAVGIFPCFTAPELAKYFQGWDEPRLFRLLSDSRSYEAVEAQHTDVCLRSSPAVEAWPSWAPNRRRSSRFQVFGGARLGLPRRGCPTVLTRVTSYATVSSETSEKKGFRITTSP
jgi:hypothetical protein